MNNLQFVDCGNGDDSKKKFVVCHYIIHSITIETFSNLFEFNLIVTNTQAMEFQVKTENLKSIVLSGSDCFHFFNKLNPKPKHKPKHKT